MNASRALWMLPVLGAFALSGCDTGRVTEPITDPVSFSEEDRIALDVIADEGAVQAAMDLIDVPLRTAGRHGKAWPMPATDAVLAREWFQKALQAMRAGDSTRAVERAREARRLVVRAMVGMRGANAVTGLIERAEGLAEAVGNEPQMYAHAERLRAELGDLALQARERLRFGDSTGAGEHAVLAQQRHRQRLANAAARPGGAEVAVQLGDVSVSLATQIVTDAGGPSSEQSTLLAAAGVYAADAHAALVAGDDLQAIHLADMAQWTSLEAVVWPGGVSQEEAAALADRAEALYTAAAATEPTGLAAELLAWARALLDFGELAVITQAPPGGAGALWRASVICTWIIG